MPRPSGSTAFIDVIQIFHLKIDDTVHGRSERLRARALRENRLDDMSDEVIHRRLQTYYDETFKTLSFYPSELIFDVDAGRRTIDVLCDIVNRLAADQEALRPDDCDAITDPLITDGAIEDMSAPAHVCRRVAPGHAGELRRRRRSSPTSRTRPSCPS